MQEWLEIASQFLMDQIAHMWLWFDSLDRQEWLIVMATCCAVGFMMMKSWGTRGPC